MDDDFPILYHPDSSPKYLMVLAAPLWGGTPSLSAPAHCNLILTASEWLNALPDHGTKHQGHQGAGSRCFWYLCQIHGPRDTAKERSAPSSSQLISFHLPFEPPSPQRAGAQCRGTSFQASRRWVLDANLAAETRSQEHSHMPPWTHRPLERRRKPLGSPLSCISPVVWMASGHHCFPLCWSWSERALRKVSAGIGVSISVHECIGSNRH